MMCQSSADSEVRFHFWFFKNKNLVSYVPKIGKSVILLSTMHSTTTIDKETAEQQKPDIITFYNMTKGGVDVVDQTCILLEEEPKDGPCVYFFNFLDVVAINSAVIYKAVKQDGGMARKYFIKQLALQLMRDALNMRNQAKNLSRDLQVLIQKHAGTSSFEQKELNQLLKENQALFSQHETDIGRIAVQHKIHTIEHPPISCRPYRRLLAEYDEIKRQVEELSKKGLIRESQSPWAFPVVLVSKKDGSQRMCIDYRKLNAITIDDKQPLPYIQDMFDRLHNAKYFTTLDIAWGYWHVEIHPDSVEKTAFITNDGHYEFLVMPFGLKNAQSTFQRIIQHIIGNLLWNGVCNYQDDILIYSSTFKDHIELMKKIFDKLKENNIKLKLKKCSFAKQEIRYLGHIIGHNKIKPDPEKTKAINEFPQPKTVKQPSVFQLRTRYPLFLELLRTKFGGGPFKPKCERHETLADAIPPADSDSLLYRKEISIYFRVFLKSLNGPRRRQEREDILTENQRLLSRLFRSRGINLDWTEVMRSKNLLQRNRNHSAEKSINLLLRKKNNYVEDDKSATTSKPLNMPRSKLRRIREVGYSYCLDPSKYTWGFLTQLVHSFRHG
ncbi:K02A2.6-like [Cordylochernes scorpioides]|uniref:K02A2.6-like n=1 Tax=Cordylochernes scorpioides TaxID=51811 RepID=A0ABY6LNP8_9ARAC|nr:K02A2.6-like [Cordylochernes scorpioides]